VLPSHISVGPTLAESRRICPREKELIGREAAMLVSDGDALVIDGGYTTYQVAINLKARNLSVVTNSLDVVRALLPRDDVSLILIGGEISRTSGTMVGPISENQLHHFNAAKAILGADAVDPEHGLCSPLHSTAQTKQAMIRSARELIVVADALKLGRSALYRVAPLEAVSTLVTDDRADPDILEAFRACGTEVVVATANGLSASRKDG
jgi:DeoR/GlpR family transcriptional regulator of sugar metabolism